MDEHLNNLGGAKSMRQRSRQPLKRMDSFGEYLRWFTICRLRSQRWIIFFHALKYGRIFNLGGGTVAVHE
jgi:hypothetical protein